ncbi:MAG: hypothetical protein OQL07_06840 [Gammaproteobacteria bacterium]|nr:hypothetical protein [Gammaproteobacteria bacterium]MCW8992917.1 hypothetical protein [Gammaproteobacteria bacterium]
MKTPGRILSFVALISLLAGCGSSSVEVRPDALTSTKKIALIQVSEPDSYVGQDFGSPAIMFGVVGGAIAGGSSENARKSLDQLAAEAKFHAGSRFTNLLKDELIKSGYKVDLISVKRENKTKLLEAYDNVDASGADAILDIAIESIGYATEHPLLSPEWRPASQVHVALVDSRNKNTIYSEKLMYGYHNPFMSGTDIDAPKEYFFKNKEALFADASKLVEGMKGSVDAVVGHVVLKLKK